MHRGMRADHAIEFRAGDIFATAADDVALARDKTVAAIAVTLHQVPGFEPADCVRTLKH